MLRPLTLTLLLASPLACNPPPKEAHDAAPVAPSPPVPVPVPVPVPGSSASASPSASASASASACTTDTDCRLFSSYCEEAPCACRALPSRDPSPKCLGDAPPKVRCFADPCMKKAAHCQSGACVLTAR